MEEADRKTILHMSETLDKILEVLSKPPSKLAKVFEFAATCITLLGILGVIDIMRSWLGG